MPRPNLLKARIIISLAVAGACPLARGEDISGVLPAAADQPQTHVYLQTAVSNGQGGTMPGSILEVDDGFGDEVYDIQGFLDTGTSGVLLSLETQAGLGVGLENGITFNDVAVGGVDTYNVSTQYYLSAAPFSIDNDIEIGNDPPALSAYTPVTGAIRMQTNPNEADFLVGPLDIFGMPVMQGKVVVMDLRPPNNPDPNYLGETKTYFYSPGTPFNAGAADTDPGIPPGQLHVKLSYADYGQFTQLLPTSTPASYTPLQCPNPMIGPDPVKLLNTGSTDKTQAVRIAFGSHASTGSFLFDTGAQASFISTAEAMNLHVEYATDSQGNQLLDANGDPYLVSTDPGHAEIANQFAIPITGAGGATVDAAGFYLDRLSLPTVEGDPINFDGAPVLVTDVTAQDPITGKSLTLDGDFGMNFIEPSITADFSQETTGAFDWATFDQPNGLLGFTLTTGLAVPVIVSSGNVLTASSDSDIGAGGSDLALYGGTLAVGGSFSTSRPFAVSSTGGTITAASGATLTLSPATLTWSAGTLNITNSSAVVFSVTSNDVMVWAGSALNINAGSNVIVNGTTDPFSDSQLPGEHVTIIDNGSLMVNVNSTIGGITGNGRLAIGNGSSASTLQIASGTGLSSVGSLTIGTGSTLDLTNNRLILSYSSSDPISSIAGYIKSGYNSGGWNGPGIISTTAQTKTNGLSYGVGYADGKDGVVWGLSSGQIEVKYTLLGDANLDGLVNAADFTIVAANFNQTVTGWDKGDFNYDGLVNAADFLDLAVNFNQGVSGAASAGDVAALDAFAAANGLLADVPEPACAGMIAMAGLGILGRRRRSSRRADPNNTGSAGTTSIPSIT
ncbi:MAG: dockerin type I domain-containing protein [Tepidisphaeraceae bacterium]